METAHRTLSLEARSGHREGWLGRWRQEAQRRGHEGSLKANSYLVNEPITHPASVTQGVLRY